MPTNLAGLSVALGYPYQAAGATGDGRYRSYLYPEPATINPTTGAGGGPGIRQRVTQSGAGTSVSAFNGGATTTCSLVNSTAGVLMTQNPGQGILRFQYSILNVKTSASILGNPLVDDTQCWRVWANLAASVGAPNTNDWGLWMISPGGGTPRVIVDAGIGFGFQLGQTGVVSFMLRGANGLITIPVTAPPFDVTKHHTYEIVGVSAGPSSPAQIIPLIDSQALPIPLLSRVWVPGTNLPVNQNVGGQSGFVPAIVCSSSILNSFLHFQQVGIALSPSLAGLQ